MSQSFLQFFLQPTLPRTHRFRRSVLFLSLAVVGITRVVAQTNLSSPTETSPLDITLTPKINTKTPNSTQRIDGVVVVGNPLEAGEVVAPVSILSGTELVIKRASTLGETLNGLPGVSSTWFGPNASRPVIRGLDGDRVRILNNLGSTLDASSLSPDHNPSIDPLAVERIEVLRGPAALLYGGAAIGGVVNIVDNRIPNRAVDGVSGRVETRYGGAERERGTSAVLEAGRGALAIHADGFNRETGDYRVPSSTGVGVENGGRVVNSGAKSRGGALGASWQLSNGYVGAAHSEYRSIYGTVAEPTVTINMRQKRDVIEANLSDLSGPISGVFAKASRSDYQHTEFDNGEAQTVFKNKGSDFRGELKHAAIGTAQMPIKGLVGVQVEQFDFSALGAEAFVPQTRTKSAAAFVFEELDLTAWKFTIGGRIETNRIASEGAAESGAARFGASRERKFTLGSTAFGTTYKVSASTSLASNLSYSERAPTYYELFADGPHGATGAYEQGNPAFKRERATAIELSLRFKEDRLSASAGIFSQQFRNYISLRRTGINRDTEGNGAAGGAATGTGVTDCGDGTSQESGCTAEVLPGYQYEAISARLIGFEAEAKWRLIAQPYTLDIESKVDYVRADNRTNGDPLPRIVPLRLSGSVAWGSGDWGARLDVQHTSKQKRFSSDDAVGGTDSFTLVNAAVTYKFETKAVGGLVFLSATNIGNQRAFNASSIDSIRALAPLPGRGLKAGVQLSF
jgi:iron complex outermembrane recepter protein